MIPVDENYVYGNTAEKLEVGYSELPQERIIKRKKIIKKTKSNIKAKLKMVSLVLLSFSLCLILMYRYAIITQLSYDLNKKTASYEKFQDSNTKLQIEIEEQVSLDRVKLVAEEKLGMHKPNKYQIVNVGVPRESYTQIRDGYEFAKQKENIFLALIDKVGKVTDWLY